MAGGWHRVDLYKFHRLDFAFVIMYNEKRKHVPYFDLLFLPVFKTSIIDSEIFLYLEIFGFARKSFAGISNEIHLVSHEIEVRFLTVHMNALRKTITTETTTYNFILDLY